MGQVLSGEMFVEDEIEQQMGAVENLVGAVGVHHADLVEVRLAGVLGDLRGAEVPVLLGLVQSHIFHGLAFDIVAALLELAEDRGHDLRLQPVGRAERVAADGAAVGQGGKSGDGR